MMSYDTHMTSCVLEWCFVAYRDVLARFEVIADVLADCLPKLLSSHLLHKPHQPGLLPV